MTRVLTMLLLTGAFLGGYYLGHLPNSPDIFDWGRRTYERAVEMGDKAEDYVAEDGDDRPISARVPRDAYLFHREAERR